ncbi:MAG: PD40 domain-containing protein [Anaerolineaceae bacterium]|nr:PD40 domain-containing protein [Anaerolineaceae bacterium]
MLKTDYIRNFVANHLRPYPQVPTKITLIQWSILLLISIISVCTTVGCTSKPGPERYEGIDFLEMDSETRFLESAWSPDGQKVVVRYEKGWLEDIGVAVIDITTGVFHPILPEQEDTKFTPEWSPDSQSLIVTIYVERPTEDTPFNIGIVDAQSGQFQQELWFGSAATWGSEPNKIIVIDNDIGHLKEQVPIFEIDLDSGKQRQFAQTEAAMVTVTDSFDVSSDGYLTVMNVDGLQIIDIESGELIGVIDKRLRTPNWSPDGDMLVFTYDVSEDGEKIYHDHIFLSTADGSCFSDSLDLQSRIWTIDWSPDGQQLVFATFEPGKLYFMDLTIGVGKELIESFNANCIMD